MNLPDRAPIRAAYEKAVVALLNIAPVTEEEAEQFIDAMSDLIFTTMQTYLEEEEHHDTTGSH